MYVSFTAFFLRTYVERIIALMNAKDSVLITISSALIWRFFLIYPFYIILFSLSYY